MTWAQKTPSWKKAVDVLLLFWIRQHNKTLRGSYWNIFTSLILRKELLKTSISHNIYYHSYSSSLKMNNFALSIIRIPLGWGRIWINSSVFGLFDFTFVHFSPPIKVELTPIYSLRLFRYFFRRSYLLKTRMTSVRRHHKKQNHRECIYVA